jgi:hypothetical protein
VPIALKSETLKLLEPYGPVQTCNGIALPLPFYLDNTIFLHGCESWPVNKKTETVIDVFEKTLRQILMEYNVKL